MIKVFSSAFLLGAAAMFAASTGTESRSPSNHSDVVTASSNTISTLSSAPVHCQVPCGIYGDKMRIDMLMEDAATIEKGMKMIREADNLNNALQRNQTVRWVMNKDEHAQMIQETIANYWLAQRIKAPKEPDDTVAMEKYHKQLATLHKITVAAMKCKQSVNVAHVQDMKSKALEFSRMYFSEEDWKHIHSHHVSEHGGQ